MRVLFSVLIAVFLLSGCQVASDLNEMQSQMTEINDELQAALEMDAQIGWNIRNGVLSQVTVMLPADQVKDQSVHELKELTYPIIQKHFEKTPQVYQLVVVFQEGN